jgi:hypothetical protein
MDPIQNRDHCHYQQSLQRTKTVPEETKMFGIPNHDCFLAMDLIAIVGHLQFLENVEESKRHADE